MTETRDLQQCLLKQCLNHGRDQGNWVCLTEAVLLGVGLTLTSPVPF